jgi:hypothetical protein
VNIDLTRWAGPSAATSAPRFLKGPNNSFFRVYRQHQISALPERGYLPVDVAELLVLFRCCGPSPFF